MKSESSIQEDLGLKLNPITKLKLFRAVRKIILGKMNRDEIIPKRAGEILEYVKKRVVKIASPTDAKQLYLHLEEKFPEFKGLKEKFDAEEKEKIDQAFSFLVDVFIDKGNIDLASELMDQMCDSEEQAEYLKKIKARYPIEFQESIKKFLKNQKKVIK